MTREDCIERAVVVGGERRERKEAVDGERGRGIEKKQIK